ncbi:PAS domain-containing methyl-accepting chemotaxis protein [Pseudoalteromonas sp. MMG012]|uniref:methyl-accepting chemotaxis protein n=1 Tax=Pseudoalteromonas sp. MMG012 TaxID=2822686 RepID=UPI001B39E9B6|nr:PAS domain-containing methyl-accepting chemotaxis protein [Pseudoalteromonas sp. MMG012]MBQ4852790.1 methyl-accepting chemotaxis protein [Pseudoalteromonas sp. MMG012]
MATGRSDYTNREYDYPNTYNLLSTTNVNGQIKYANKQFCEVAGFELKDLEGKPHNIVRHPTMPKVAFKNLWDFIGSGKPWMGMVKNRCKNGDHYWVNAYVTPIADKNGKIVEYQSVRIKPDRNVVNRAEKVYAQLNNGTPPESIARQSWSLSSQMIAIIIAFYVLTLFLTSLASPWSYILETVLVIGIIALTYSRLAPIRVLSEKAKKVYDNPLMQKIYLDRVNDISAIELALLARESELRAVLGRVKDSSSTVTEHADETVAECNRSADLLNSQQAQTGSLATAINEMTATIAEIASNTTNAASQSESALESVKAGSMAVNENMENNYALSEELSKTQKDIEDLNAQTVNIGGVVDVIRGISEQTNLLALNAAIEAARAGEQGRGFAVVADEVRALAQRTQESTKEIDSIIADLRQRAERAVGAIQNGVDKSGECVSKAEGTKHSLESINALVNDISSLNYQIATSTEEMSGVSNELNNNAVTISQLANDSLESSDRTLKTMSDTQTSLVDQESLVDQFMAKFIR